MDIPAFLSADCRPVSEKLRAHGEDKLAALYEKCFASTLETTVRFMPNGNTFLITGDIPAMWLRDSSAQVRHYLPFAAENSDIADMIEGLLWQQFWCITLDAYANAFNMEPNGACYSQDTTDIPHSPWVWERKYEIDSLCYPVHLAYDFWQLTGRTGWHNDTYQKATDTILALWQTEQRHSEASPYFFRRDNCPPSDTLSHDGKGAPTAYTGMTWSGFRPSDDACRYGYLVPSNFFAAAVLEKMAAIAETLSQNSTHAQTARALRGQILQGIRTHAITRHTQYGDIYAYETDGLGNYCLMDDANVPSLLSLPYLGADIDPEIYANTRRFILSKDNPYYYAGTAARGIGSPHTPPGYVWPIALSMQGLTAENAEEMQQIAHTLAELDAGTLQMHEGVDVNNPANFTRPWFAWANSLFSEFAAKYAASL